MSCNRRTLLAGLALAVVLALGSLALLLSAFVLLPNLHVQITLPPRPWLHTMASITASACGAGVLMIAFLLGVVVWRRRPTPHQPRTGSPTPAAVPHGTPSAAPLSTAKNPRLPLFNTLQHVQMLGRNVAHTVEELILDVDSFVAYWGREAIQLARPASLLRLVEAASALLQEYAHQAASTRGINLQHPLATREPKPGVVDDTPADRPSSHLTPTPGTHPTANTSLLVQCADCGCRNMWDYDHLVCRDCGHLLHPPKHLDKNYTPNLLPHEQEDSLDAAYQGGHRGTDYYLRHFWRGRWPVAGTLSADAEGLAFSSTPLGRTRNVKRIRLRWPAIRDINAEVRWHGFVDRLLGDRQPWVSLAVRVSGQSEEIRFTIPHAGQQLAERLQLKLESYRQHQHFREQLARQHIEDRRLDRLSPRGFEELVKRLFEAMGYTGRLTPPGPDEGVDLVLQRKGEKVVVQCKRHRNPVGQPVVRDLYDALLHQEADRAYLVTTSTFTEPATRWAEGKPLQLIDKYQLAALLDAYGSD